MKKSKSILILFATMLISCSKEENIPINSRFIKENTLKVVTPQYAKIGDTLTIEGENLDKVNFQFNDYIITNPLSVDSNKALIIVPPLLYNEKVIIYSLYGQSWPGAAIDSIAFNLIGFFSLNFPLINGEISHIKAVNEKLFFTSIGSCLYKTIDGGYVWTLIKDFGSNICSFFFLDESNGWICINEDSGYKLYFTDDGGGTFQYLFTTGQNMSGKSITDMYFSFIDKGYLLTGKGEIYITNGNSHFELIYDFPESNEEMGTTEFFYLSVYNNSIMATGSTGENGDTPVLITGKNNTFSYTLFNESLGKVQLISDNDAFLNKGNKLYQTEDGGDNWVKVSDTKLYNFYFLNKNIGFGISSDEYITHHHTILHTANGGIEWLLGFDTLNEYTTDMAFSGKVGLISGFRGQLWKYIEK